MVYAHGLGPGAERPRDVLHRHPGQNNPRPPREGQLEPRPARGGGAHPRPPQTVGVQPTCGPIHYQHGICPEKSVRTQLPISNNMLAAFATYMLLKSHSFPRNRPAPSGTANQVGTSVGTSGKNFKPLHLALERKTAAASNASDMFRTAAVAQRLHGILPGLPTASGHGGDAQGILEMLDGQFDALAAASSISNAALD